MTDAGDNVNKQNRAQRGRRPWVWLILGGACGLPTSVWGAETAAAPRGLDVWGLLEAGGTIGWIIVASSVWMVALLLQQLL